MEKKNNTGLIVLVIVLLIALLGCIGYIVYDKVLVKDETVKEHQEEIVEEKEEEIEQKDSAYFDEYLKPFTSCDGIFISRNTEKFNDDDIHYFVINYALQKILTNNQVDNSNSNENEYNMSQTEILNIISQYFNVDYDLNKLFNSLEKDTITKIEKIDANNYKIKWPSVGCGYIAYKNPIVNYNGINVTVKYELYNMMEDKNVGDSTFYLKYNNGNYNVIKIEE